jgi:hypothetical protein
LTAALPEVKGAKMNLLAVTMALPELDLAARRLPLPAKFRSIALLHSVYLHNQLLHTVTKQTPFEGYFGMKPDLGHLKMFVDCKCVLKGEVLVAVSWTSTTLRAFSLDIWPQIIMWSILIWTWAL